MTCTRTQLIPTLARWESTLCWNEKTQVLTPESMHSILSQIVEGDCVWLKRMPHGSGIDLAWQIVGPLKNGTVLLHNSYHLMDEHGFYDGWHDFKVRVFRHRKTIEQKLCGPCEGLTQIVQRKGHWDWEVLFTGVRIRRASAYGLREYLEDTLSYILEPTMKYANSMAVTAEEAGILDIAEDV